MYLTNPYAISSGYPSGVVATDNFVRADSGTLGVNWTDLRSTVRCQIVSNECRQTSAGYSMERWAGSGGFNNNQYSKITIASTVLNYDVTINGSSSVDNSTSYVFGVIAGGNYSLTRRVNEADTVIDAGAAWTLVAGDVFEIRKTGTTITTYINTVLKQTVVDATLTGGLPGFNVYGGTGARSVTVWTGGNV